MGKASRCSRPIFVATLMLVLWPAAGTTSQTPNAETPLDSARSALRTAAAAATVSDRPATLVFANRAIVEFRATVLSRTPSERAEAAAQLIERLVSENPLARVATHTFEEGALVSVGGQPVFGVLSADTDPLVGESLDRKAREAGSRLQVAITDAVELRDPARLYSALGLAGGATAVLAGVLWLLLRTDRIGSTPLRRMAERRLAQLPGGEGLARVANESKYVRRAFGLVVTVVGLFATYAWLTFVLRQFPYTRPLGESLRGRLLSQIGSIGARFVEALPDILTVVVIVIVTRFAARIVASVFDAVEQGRIRVPWGDSGIVQPTRRIAIALLWVFGLIVAYEFLPGSDSDAFKAVSIFVGLMVSLGSTGIMNQVISGFTITYSRALRKDDFVKIGETEGIVTHLGALSAKIKTPRNEEITIPNAVVISHPTINYSSHYSIDGLWTPTSVTIGYDVPWRQVHALLLLAAERTPGIRGVPKPVVRQAALQDSYVEYTLLVCPEQPKLRGLVLDALHANIQDAFNEFGVQMMSPKYESDPKAPKVVPQNSWYAAPANPPSTGQPSVPARR